MGKSFKIKLSPKGTKKTISLQTLQDGVRQTTDMEVRDSELLILEKLSRIAYSIEKSEDSALCHDLYQQIKNITDDDEYLTDLNQKDITLLKKAYDSINIKPEVWIDFDSFLQSIWKPKEKDAE